MSINPINFDVFGSAGATSNVSFNKTDETLGIYSMGTFSPITSLHFTAGVRGDFNIARGDKNWLISPRYAGVWEASSSSVFKLLYNTGFLRPAEDQKTKATPASLTADKEIPSEEMTQTDFVYLQKLGSFFEPEHHAVHPGAQEHHLPAERLAQHLGLCSRTHADGPGH